MTREEATAYIKEWLKDEYLDGKDRAALTAIIEESEQEPKYCDRNICIQNEYNGIGCDECEVTKSKKPCIDAVSRQTAIVQLSHNKTGDDDCDVIIQKDIETIKALPPVTPHGELPSCESCMNGNQEEKAKLCQKSYLAGMEHSRQESCDKCVYSTKDGDCQYDDITEAIPPFEPCDDAISRQYLLDNCVVDKVTMPYVPVGKIKNAPPVTVQPKTGHWNRVTDKAGHLVWECDCGWQQRFATNFCPDCGMKMEANNE